MAGIELGNILSAFSLAIHILIYIAIFIFIVKAKNTIVRLHLVIVVMGFFVIIWLVDFWRAQFFILA